MKPRTFARRSTLPPPPAAPPLPKLTFEMKADQVAALVDAWQAYRCDRGHAGDVRLLQVMPNCISYLKGMQKAWPELGTLRVAASRDGLVEISNFFLRWSGRVQVTPQNVAQFRALKQLAIGIAEFLGRCDVAEEDAHEAAERQEAAAVCRQRVAEERAAEALDARSPIGA